MGQWKGAFDLNKLEAALYIRKSEVSEKIPQEVIPSDPFGC